jgi:hypothetical protein
MFEAARTTASPAAIWTIVIVAVVVLAAWLTAIFLADRSQVRASGQSRPGTMAKPALGSTWAREGLAGETEAASGEAEFVSSGRWAGGSLPGADAPEVPGEAVHEPIGVKGQYTGDEAVPEGDIPTRVDLPVQSRGPDAMPAESAQARPTGLHTMPAQRSGEADRAERSYAGPPPPDEGETGRQVPSRLRWIITRGHGH